MPDLRDDPKSTHNESVSHLHKHWRFVGLSTSKSVLIRYDGVESFDCVLLSSFRVEPNLKGITKTLAM